MGEADPVGIAFVMKDASQGVYVQGPAEEVATLQRGDLIEIEGVTHPGGFAPYVIAYEIAKVGRADVPEPLPVTLDELNAGQMDAQWVEFSGIVRSIEPIVPTDIGTPPPGTRYAPPPVTASTPGPPRMKMKLASGGARVAVEVSLGLDPEEYVDAEVSIRGLCFNLHNRNRQFVRPFVQVPRGVAVKILRKPPGNAFGEEPRPIAGLLQFDQLTGKRGHRVHVRGTVTHHQRGSILWIRDQERSLRVETAQADGLQPGDEVDVLGFPAMGVYSAVLEDAVFRKRISGPPPEPHLLEDFSGVVENDADLVQLEADLVDVRRLPGHIVLALDWNGRSIRAQMQWPDGAPVPEHWLPGRGVRVTGVCSIVADGNSPLGGLWEPRAFELLLRSAADLVVVRAPSWWNAERVVWVLSGFLACSVLAVAGVSYASRRRLKEQAHRRAMAEAEFAAIFNERNRVAREIHDTLAQNLGAIAVQLELARTHSAEIGESARAHLSTAHKLARAALADARESIWNMRSQVLEDHDLAEALEKILMRLTEGTRIVPQMKVEGTLRRLPPVIENNLLRVGQEAITNASRHASPRRIEVTLTFAARTVRLSVEDDGSGFNPVEAAGTSRRNFGLVGMRERAELLGGTFELRSAPGGGTRVTVCVSA